MNPRIRAALAALVVVLTALGAIQFVDTDGDGRPDAVKPVRQFDTPVAVPGAPDPVVDADNELQRDEEAEASDPTPADQGPDVHEDQRDERPPGVPLEQAQAGLRDNSAQGKGAPRPVGGAQNYSCRYKPVVNQSSRNGQKVLLGVQHETVSENRPGWSDVDAIWRLFNTPPFGASSTYIMDWEGNCLRLMSERAKPWTQGNFNGRSVSVEVIATGRESTAEWMRAPILRDGILASLWRDVLRRNGLPLRLVDPEGCGVQFAGLTDHNRLECGNEHVDMTKPFPMLFFVRQVQLGGDVGGTTIRTVDRTRCSQIRDWRRAGRPAGAWERKSVWRRTALERRGLTCTPAGARRR